MSWVDNPADCMTRKTYLSERIADLEKSAEPESKRGYALSTYLYLEEVGGIVNSWLEILRDPSTADYLGKDGMEKSYKFHREHAVSYLRNDKNILPKIFPDRRNMGMIANHIDMLIGDIEKQNPASGKEYAEESYKCIRQMLGGLNGWYGMLGNERVVESGPLDAYKELYAFVRPFALEMMKFELEQVERRYSVLTGGVG